MSGFDTAQFERARQGGAALGTQQFGMLQDLANRREQNRMDQEALQQRAQQIQFGQAMDLQQMDLARRQFRLDQKQESRLAEAFRAEMNQRAAEMQQAKVEKAQRIQTARAYGKVLIDDLKKSAQVTQPAMPDQRDELAAMGMQTPANPIRDAIKQMPGSGVADPVEKMNQRDLERMIELMAIEGNVEGLSAIAPAVDSAAERAAMLQKTKWAIQAAKDPNLIADPKLRAVATALVRAGQEDMMFRLVGKHLETNEQIRKDQATKKQGAAGSGAARGNAVGSLYAGMATNAAKGATDGRMRPDQATQYARFMAAAAAAKANANAVLSDGSVVLNNGQVGPDGFVRVQRPDGREEAVSPEQFAAEAASAMLQSDSTNAANQNESPDLAQDPDVIMQRILDENPNATDEEIAAELQRRGFTAGE